MWRVVELPKLPNGEVDEKAAKVQLAAEVEDVKERLARLSMFLTPQDDEDRALLMLGTTVVACLIAFWLAGGTSLAFDAFANMAFMPVMWMWIAVAAVGFLVMAGGVAAALSRAPASSVSSS